MEGGALGFVSAGLDHEVDPGATLAIRQSSLKIMDKLMEQLELGIRESSQSVPTLDLLFKLNCPSTVKT